MAKNVIATMMATTTEYTGHPFSLAYVLYSDDSVGIISNQHSSGFPLPFTEDQARFLMKQKLAGRACNY